MPTRDELISEYESLINKNKEEPVSPPEQENTQAKEVPYYGGLEEPSKLKKFGLDTASNLANIGSSAVQTGAEMIEGGAKDLGLTKAAKSIHEFKSQLAKKTNEFSDWVDPSDDNAIPKIIGRITPYVAAAYLTKNPMLITSGMAGLQAAGSGEPDEPYSWTLAKQGTATAAAAGTGMLTNSAVKGLTSVAKGNALGEVINFVRQGISTANPNNVRGGAGVSLNALNSLKNKASSFYLNPTVESRAYNAGVGALTGNVNNLLDYQTELHKDDVPSTSFTGIHN